MPPDAAETIKQSISMLDICHQYGIQVNRAGFACCPFHGEKTGSMKIYPGNKGWHCFGCHQGGDVISFVCQYFGLDFVSAVKKLNDDFNLGLQLDGATDREREREARRLAYQRRKEQERRRKRLLSLQKARDEALARFAELDKAAELLESEASLRGLEDIACIDLYNIILDGISDRTANAIINIDGAWYTLREAEDALRQYEKESFTAEKFCIDGDAPINTERR